MSLCLDRDRFPNPALKPRSFHLYSYFQAIQGSSPVRSSVQTFPLSLTIAPLAIMTGAAVAIIGKYNWSNWAGWVMMTTGVGLLALLKVRSEHVSYLCNRNEDW